MSQRAGTAAPDTASARAIAVDRAAFELRRGRIAAIVAPPGPDPVAMLVLAAEMADDPALADLKRLSGTTPALALTAQRAGVLHIGPTGHDTILLPIAAHMTAAVIRDLADATADLERPMQGPFTRLKTPPPEAARAAIALCKQARLLPAAVVAAVADDAALRDAGILRVAAEDIFAAPLIAAQTLRLIGGARLPLAGAAHCRISAFRPADGGHEHLAIVIGEPPPGAPVLARLHSQCFTGDLLASLRCDCGDQLRGAVALMAEAGGGVLLYMAQEGRGIGLMNKLRAYTLQEQGFDTYEANRRLGFAADERLFEPAAEMLRQMGYTRVRLLTNNPGKVAELTRCGIEVVERVGHAFPPNNHNEAYLAAKKKHSGHYL
jgi:GTP cyclohydrolase II